MAGRVLLVDEDPEVISTVQMLLSAHGYEVLAENTTAGALATALVNQPDLVILDIGIQGGQGSNVIRRLREQIRTVNIPIILLTAQASENDFRRAFAIGVAKYITKPFRPIELLHAVDEIIERCRFEEA